MRKRQRAARSVLAGAMGGALAGATIVASVLVPQMGHLAAEARQDGASRLETIRGLRGELAAAADRRAALESELASQRDIDRRLLQELDAVRRQGAKTPETKAASRNGDHRDRPPEPALDLPRCAPGSLDPMCIR
jgi:hypothetical protein